MHISTLYSNCNRQHIDEKVYDMEIGYEKIIQVSFQTDSASFCFCSFIHYLSEVCEEKKKIMNILLILRGEVPGALFERKKLIT